MVKDIFVIGKDFCNWSFYVLVLLVDDIYIIGVMVNFVIEVLCKVGIKVVGVLVIVIIKEFIVKKLLLKSKKVVKKIYFLKVEMKFKNIVS